MILAGGEGTRPAAAASGDSALTCRELITVLAEYFETALAPGATERIQAHLDACDECRAYLATYRRTREVTAAAQRVAMPDEMKGRLRMFLLSELGDLDATRE